MDDIGDWCVDYYVEENIHGIGNAVIFVAGGFNIGFLIYLMIKFFSTEFTSYFGYGPGILSLFAFLVFIVTLVTFILFIFDIFWDSLNGFFMFISIISVLIASSLLLGCYGFITSQKCVTFKNDFLTISLPTTNRSSYPDQKKYNAMFDYVEKTKCQRSSYCISEIRQYVEEMCSYPSQALLFDGLFCMLMICALIVVNFAIRNC